MYVNRVGVNFKVETMGWNKHHRIEIYPIYSLLSTLYCQRDLYAGQ